MEQVLDQCLTPTNKMVEHLFEIENAFINTQHPDFIGSGEAMANLFREGDDEEGEDEQDEFKTRQESLLDKKKSSYIEEAEVYDDESKKQGTTSLFNMFMGQSDNRLA